MATTIEKRFLILDRTNQAMKPSEHGYPIDDVKNQKKFSPSFLDATKARKFGAYLADMNPGELYFLVEVAGCVSVPEGAVWADAVPAVLPTADIAAEGIDD